MAYEIFTGQLDDEEKSGYTLFTGEIDEPVRRRDVTPFKVDVQQPQGRRDVTPFKVDVQQPRAAPVRQAEAAPQVSAEYSPSGDDFGSAIMAAAAPAAPVRSKSVLDNLPPVDRTKEPGFMLRPEFVDQVRNSFASIPPEKRRQALIDAAAGSDATAQAAQRILLDVQKEDKFLQEQEGSRQGMINIVRNAPRVKPEVKLGNQPKPPVVFPDLTPTVLERADAYKTPESERIANRLRQDEATRTVVGAETSLEALADRADRESRDFSAEAFAKENPYRAALESGGRQIISGLANSIPTIVDFAARVIDATKTDVDTTGNLSMSFDTDTFNNQNVRAPTYQWADRMAITARSLMPEAGRQNMASAFSKGEFGSWLGLNLTAQAPQMATSFVAAILPAARPFLLPAMGAQSAGQSYGEGDSSLGALIKGGAEIVGERITLGVFDKSLASLSKLPLSLQAPTVQSVGRALAATGKVATTQAVVGAIEETTTKILQNGVDRYLENKDVGLLDQTADAAVLGAFMEGPLALAQGKAAFKSGKSAFAEAFAGDVAGGQFDPAAIDAYARRALDVQSYDAAIIRPDQTAKVQRDQADLQSSTSATDAATAADNLSGSLNELLVPENAITPLPLDPTLDVGQMTPSTARADLPLDVSQMVPSTARADLPLDVSQMVPSTDRAEPPLGVPTTLDLNAPAAEINQATEQQFGLDKLRINAPRPRSIQGTPVDNLSDDQLQAITGDESVAPISRRSAAIELTARQGEQAPAPTPVAETRVMTPEELGAMPIRDRRALANQFDQTENEDGTITFTAKSGAAPSTAIVPTPGTEQTLGTAPVRDVGNQPVLDNETVRADAQRSLDRWAVDNGQAIPAKLNPAPEAEDRAVSTIANLLGSQFGTRVIAFHDTNPGAVQGVAVGGTAFVNTANVVTNVGRVSLHELKHTIEQIAFTERQAGLTDTSAQKFTAQIDSIFDDMTDEGKRAYVTNFLHASELAALDSTPDIKESRIQEILQSPVLRSEMTADFMGNRATDKKFWADVAKADPGGFKGFVQKWVSVIDNLMSTLRGQPKLKTESAKVDQYVRDLGKAKMVAREALIAYRQGTLQQFESAPAASLRQGEINAPTIGTQGSEVLPGPTAQNRPGFSQDGGGPTPAYGTPRAGAISVVGRHYSTTPRQTLSGAYYGQGLKGAERTRLDSSTDPRLKNRVYFYVDQGAGIRPESGVGGYAHEAKLDNIYDPQTRLIKPQADANAFESAVINAGFDGYIAPFGNGQSAVVLLGQKHKAVPVKQIGQPQAAALPAEAAPTTLKKGLLSREASQVDTGNIPGSRMRMGTLEIPAGQVEAANVEMERIGSQIRFNAKQKTVAEGGGVQAGGAVGAGNQKRQGPVPVAKTGTELELNNVKFSAKQRDLTDIPTITFRDLVGKKVMGIKADLTTAGVSYTGIDGSQLEFPVEMLGGPNFVRLPENTKTNVVWAVRGGATLSKIMAKVNESDYVLVHAMNDNSHLTNATVSQAYIQTVEAYLRDKRITPANLLALDKIVQSSENKNSLPDFPGFESPGILGYIDGLSFDQRGALAKMLETKQAQALGLPNLDRFRRETMDAEYAGYRQGDTMLVIEIDKKNPTVKLGEKGTKMHPSYPLGLRGRVVGKLAKGVNYELIFRDYFENKVPTIGNKEAGAWYAFDRVLPVQEITSEIADALGEGGYENITSSRQAQASLALANNQWLESGKTKATGGISNTEFVDALRANEGVAALTLYDADEVKAGVKDGSFKIYQLGKEGGNKGIQIFFGLKRGKPWYAGMIDGIKDNEVEVVSVINNEPGAPGVAIPAIITKAIAEGATVLDAFAVKSARFPDGFLPEMYGQFGFETIGTIPFDASYYDANKLSDLKAFWAKGGWKEADGYPDVVVMRWKGNNADRQSAIERYVRTGETRVSTGPDYFGTATNNLAEQRNPPRGGEGRTRGGDNGQAGGDQGASNAAPVVRRAYGSLQELANLSAGDIRNLGLNPEDVARLRNQLAPGATPDSEAIFAGLEKRGLAKSKAETALANHPDGAQIKYVQENFNDILIQLEDADKVKINCK